jgi:hypothetical protein
LRRNVNDINDLSAIRTPPAVLLDTVATLNVLLGLGGEVLVVNPQGG